MSSTPINVAAAAVPVVEVAAESVMPALNVDVPIVITEAVGSPAEVVAPVEPGPISITEAEASVEVEAIPVDAIIATIQAAPSPASGIVTPSATGMSMITAELAITTPVPTLAEDPAEVAVVELPERDAAVTEGIAIVKSEQAEGEVSTAVAAQPEPEQADAEAAVSVKAPSSGEKRKRSEISVGVSAGDENAETATTDTPVEKRICVEQQQSESEVVAEVLHQA